MYMGREHAGGVSVHMVNAGLWLRTFWENEGFLDKGLNPNILMAEMA